MGRIKSKLIKRTTLTLKGNKELEFSKDFNDNKKMLNHISPSKKIRNQIAGYMTCLMKRAR